MHEASNVPTIERAKAHALWHKTSQSRVYRESQLDECSLSSSMKKERASRQEKEKERKMSRERTYFDKIKRETEETETYEWTAGR